MKNVLPQIFAYLDNRDIFFVALTCKGLYSTLKGGREYWHKKCDYDEIFMRSICAKNIQKVIVRGHMDKCDALDHIKKFSNIESLYIYYASGEIITMCITKLNWLKVLKIDVDCIRFEIVKKLLASNTLESLIITYTYINDEDDEQMFEISKIGKSFKRIILDCEYVSRGITNLKYDPKIKGLQILEFDSRTFIFGRNIIDAQSLIVVTIDDNLKDICDDAMNLIELKSCPEDCQIISESIIRNLTKLEFIDYIEIDNIRSDTFGKLVNLRILSLDYKNFIDVNFESLQKLTYLSINGPSSRRQEISFEKLFCLKSLELLIYYRYGKFPNETIDLDIEIDIDSQIEKTNNILDVKKRYKLNECFDENTFPKLEKLEYGWIIWTKIT
jgi:hypothetical protein